jgi:hypothetical protein
MYAYLHCLDSWINDLLLCHTNECTGDFYLIFWVYIIRCQCWLEGGEVKDERNCLCYEILVQKLKHEAHFASIEYILATKQNCISNLACSVTVPSDKYERLWGITSSSHKEIIKNCFLELVPIGFSMFISLHVRVWELLGRFSLNLILRSFTRICWHIQIFVKNENNEHFTWRLRTFLSMNPVVMSFVSVALWQGCLLCSKLVT